MNETSVADALQLQNQHRSGANWFFWIAALSMVNSVIILANGEWSFIIGLGITQVFDAIAVGVAQEAPEAAGAAKTVAIVMDLVVASVFVLFGVLARKMLVWAFVVGMVLYALDGLLFLLVGDWLSLGFHVFALFGLFGGLQACKKLRVDTPPPSVEPIVAS